MHAPGCLRGLHRLAFAIWLTSLFNPAYADEEFDLDQLKSLGIGAAIAEYFRHGARFLPGDQRVEVIVNGDHVGQRDALFDPNGNLCFTKAFIQSVGLVDIDESLLKIESDRKCADYRVMSPRAIIALKPNYSIVDITVPIEHLALASHASKFKSGGVGAVLNYRAYATRSDYGDGRGASSKYVDSVAGLNVDNWIFRSSQSLSVDGGVEHLSWGGAYVAKTFPSQAKTLQFGRISVKDLIFGGIQINGVQWIPERASLPPLSYPVNGLAVTRSTVVIRQNDMLLYRTVVPPGPFSLSNYYLRNTSTDLQVTVTDDAGVSNSFSVPAALLMQTLRTNAVEGWHFNVGKVWTGRGGDEPSPLLFTASHGWNYGLFSGTGGTLISPGYTSWGFQLGLALGQSRRHSTFVRATTTHDLDDRAHGASAGWGVSSQIFDNLSTSASFNLRAGQYRGVQQAAKKEQIVDRGNSGPDAQVALSAAWMSGWLGSISASTAHSKDGSGNVTQSYALGWAGNWRRATLSLGVSESVSRSGGGVSGARRGNTFFFANLNIPLSSSPNVRSEVRFQKDAVQVGADFSAPLHEYLNLNGSTERTFGGRAQQSSSLSASTLPRYAAIEVGMNRWDSGGSFHGSASGSIIATKRGVAFSAYEAQDSFGTASTGGVSGVRLETPGGSVWSGLGGLAAVPSFSSFTESRIEVATRSMDLDLEIERNLWEIKAARGSVIDLDIGVKRIRRIVFTLTRADGSPLPAGSMITNADGEMIATSLARGKVLISDFKDEVIYFAEDADSNRCRLEKIVFLGKKDGQLFDSATAVCVALDDKPIQKETEKPKDAG